MTEENPGRKRSHFFSGFLFAKLFVGRFTDKCNFKKFKRWSTNVPGKDMFLLDKVFFLNNVYKSHWTFAVIFVGEKSTQYYVSMDSDFHAYTTGPMRYLKGGWAEKK